MVDELLYLTVKFNVANESQPTAFKVEYVYTPLVEYVVPFHKNELHTDSVLVDELLYLTVKFNVATESQPASFKVEYV